jgi:hypothetical protein
VAGVLVLAIVTAVALLALGLLVARARRLAGGGSVPARSLAERLAVSKFEELSLLPPNAPELSLPAGVEQSTHEDAGEPLLPSSPGFDPPAFSTSWTVERAGASSGLVRVTVVVRERARDALRRPVLARLVFLLPGAAA